MSNCFICKFMNWTKYNKCSGNTLNDDKYCLLNMEQTYHGHCYWSKNSASKCEGFKDYALEQMLYSKEEILLINIIENCLPYLEFVLKYESFQGFKSNEGIYTRIEKDNNDIKIKIYKNFTQEILNKIAIPLLKNHSPKINFKVCNDENLNNFIIIENYKMAKS